MYALDTNTLIYFFKGLGRVREKLLAVSPSEIAIPAIVLFEIELGIAKSRSPEKRLAQLGELMSVTTLLPFSAQEAREAANIRADLEARGTPIGPLDNLIAGSARSHGAILVTRNLAEYQRVPGLRIEDWY
jgi:tRNA(fMet)-specific endonuclease VapC